MTPPLFSEDAILVSNHPMECRVEPSDTWLDRSVERLRRRSTSACRPLGPVRPVGKRPSSPCVMLASESGFLFALPERMIEFHRQIAPQLVDVVIEGADVLIDTDHP